MTDATHIEAYLHRLGLDAEPPSLAALARLHRAQVERIPYETTWIHLGEHCTVDREASLHRITQRHLGGYCYQLNGAFSLLLQQLGYAVSLHRGGVHGPDGPSTAELGNHLVLVVHDLPDYRSPDGRWYVDAGLADALYEPLPLVAGTYTQGPYEFALEHGDPVNGDWHFRHDPRGAFGGMSFHEAVVTMDVFVERNIELSTDPGSGFVKTMTAFRRDSDGTDALRGLVWRREPDPYGERTITDRTEWFELLADGYGLTLRDVSESDREAMWRRVNDDHARR